jgi:hypothetical protein
MKLPVSLSAFWVGLAWLRSANRWVEQERVTLVGEAGPMTVRHRSARQSLKTLRCWFAESQGTQLGEVRKAQHNF